MVLPTQCALIGWCTCRTGGEANSLLSASLTAAAISNLFMLRHLGACIDEREKLRVRSGGVGQMCCCHKRKGMTALFSQASRQAAACCIGCRGTHSCRPQILCQAPVQANDLLPASGLTLPKR